MAKVKFEKIIIQEKNKSIEVNSPSLHPEI
jgi:hypothetical protein